MPRLRNRRARFWGARRDAKHPGSLEDPGCCPTIRLGYFAALLIVLTASHLTGEAGNRAHADRPYALWDADTDVPASSECPLLQNVAFHVIQPRRPDVDGYNWLHGVALCWHRDRLFASFGHNRGAENTAGEVVNGRISSDAGRTWGSLFSLARRDDPRQAVSHGTLLSHEGRLWAFQGAFTGRLQDVHTRAYVLDKQNGRWESRGVVCGDGFFPMQQPLRMEDGNWIMAGLQVRGGLGEPDDPAAVAISRGDDFEQWEVRSIPRQDRLNLWGEATVIVDGPRVLCICRWREPYALASLSEDYGRTWTTMVPSNLPMAASKPYAGTLSTGQHYLIGTTVSDAGNRRSPLTIALTRPGEWVFRRIFRIRDAVHEGPGESGATVRLSYPYAVEHGGRLYVGYSNDGGRGGNRNICELAIIPVADLAVP